MVWNFFNKHSAETQTDVHHLTNVKDLVLIKGHWRQAPILKSQVLLFARDGATLWWWETSTDHHVSLPVQIQTCFCPHWQVDRHCFFFAQLLYWFIGVSIWSAQQENPNKRSGKVNVKFSVSCGCSQSPEVVTFFNSSQVTSTCTSHVDITSTRWHCCTIQHPISILDQQIDFLVLSIQIVNYCHCDSVHNEPWPLALTQMAQVPDQQLRLDVNKVVTFYWSVFFHYLIIDQ